MKNKLRILLLVAFTAIISTVLVQAQRQQGPMRDGKTQARNLDQCMLDLSAEQQAKIDELRIANLAKMQTLRLDVKEHKLQLERLEIAETVNQKSIDTKIDELYAAKAKIAKQRSTHHQDVRALLTKEQCVIFDTRGPRNGKGNHYQRYGGGPRAMASR